MRRRMTRGAAAGLAGGAAMAMVLLVLGEGPLGRAIALETARGGGGDGPFGRGAQQAGGGLAAILYGGFLGAVFAVVFTAVRPRLRVTHIWPASMALAGAGLLSLFVVPFLKYPANPPTVGDPETITTRTVLYLAAVGWSVVATWAAWRVWRALRERPALDVSRRAPLTAGAYLLLVAVGLVLLPPAPDPVDAPAGLIWQFRMASLAGAVVLWSTMGSVFGWIGEPQPVDGRATSRTAPEPGHR